MKRLLATTAATALAALALAAPAAADVTVTSIACPDGYKPAWVAAGTSGDKNLNGAVCLKGKKGVDERFLITVTVAGTSGGCPAGSTAVYSVYAPASYDANGTGIVCYNPTGKGSWSDDELVLTGITFG